MAQAKARPNKQLRTRLHQLLDAAKGYDRLWPKADLLRCLLFGRFRGQSGHGLMIAPRLLMTRYR